MSSANLQLKRLALLVVVVGCADKRVANESDVEPRRAHGGSATSPIGDASIAVNSDAPLDAPVYVVHTLVTPLPAGCERDNKDEIINARTKERGQYIEIRCEEGDIDTFIEIELDTEIFQTFDAYVAKQLYPTWRDAHTHVKTETLVDGWLTVRDLVGNPNLVVESQRVLAGRPVSCHAMVFKPSQLARIVSICKAVSAPK